MVHRDWSQPRKNGDEMTDVVKIAIGALRAAMEKLVEITPPVEIVETDRKMKNSTETKKLKSVQMPKGVYGDQRLAAVAAYLGKEDWLKRLISLAVAGLQQELRKGLSESDIPPEVLIAFEAAIRHAFKDATEAEVHQRAVDMYFKTMRAASKKKKEEAA